MSFYLEYLEVLTHELNRLSASTSVFDDYIGDINVNNIHIQYHKLISESTSYIIKMNNLRINELIDVIELTECPNKITSYNEFLIDKRNNKINDFLN